MKQAAIVDVKHKHCGAEGIAGNYVVDYDGKRYAVSVGIVEPNGEGAAALYQFGGVKGLLTAFELVLLSREIPDTLRSEVMQELVKLYVRLRAHQSPEPAGPLDVPSWSGDRHLRNWLGAEGYEQFQRLLAEEAKRQEYDDTPRRWWKIR